MGLKKIFPIIFVLITLSLIGIIYIQIKLDTDHGGEQTGRTAHKMMDALHDVAQELVEQRGSSSEKSSG